jgi:hypothetical protein
MSLRSCGLRGAPKREELTVSDTAAVEIERDVMDVAARRAAEEGLTVSAYITLLLRRSFERAAGEESALVYDHVGNGGDVLIDREADEMTRAMIAGLRSITTSSVAVDDPPRRFCPVQVSLPRIRWTGTVATHRTVCGYRPSRGGGHEMTA